MPRFRVQVLGASRSGFRVRETGFQGLRLTVGGFGFRLYRNVFPVRNETEARIVMMYWWMCYRESAVGLVRVQGSGTRLQGLGGSGIECWGQTDLKIQHHPKLISKYSLLRGCEVSRTGIGEYQLVRD